MVDQTSAKGFENIPRKFHQFFSFARRAAPFQTACFLVLPHVWYTAQLSSASSFLYMQYSIYNRKISFLIQGIFCATDKLLAAVRSINEQDVTNFVVGDNGF